LGKEGLLSNKVFLVGNLNPIFFFCTRSFFFFFFFFVFLAFDSDGMGIPTVLADRKYTFGDNVIDRYVVNFKCTSREMI